MTIKSQELYDYMTVTTEAIYGLLKVFCTRKLSAIIELNLSP